MSDVHPLYPNLWVADRVRRGEAYEILMEATAEPVDWADAVWADVVGHLADADNHQRSIAAQLLCNFAAHDPGDRILGDLDALIAVTKDPKFVTARHSLRSLWRIGLAGGTERRSALLATVSKRYGDSFTEKNGTLVRSDIVETLRLLYDATGDDNVRSTALELIDAEPDDKYRRKFARFWKGWARP
ncbi:hypothetical protein [Paractinoplanes rishiriensis]|uniref:Uncharacterized protein n=1 Tax=Paractinoplanes rishiriensis TaxID=1050105 RepID=A0A919JV27_9ACTN|nr:hypothetical protein [Actinoplanes rishiriensis]GIE95355.1 hypothetical protein Ari01nite_28200 [Actinoplanes rishiriensis]